MATGSQKVKTPSGWSATRGAWVKTASGTWKDVDQIYIKTPSGWNNASGQESVQQPYPYIANAQNPFIRNGQQPYPYIANAQEPVIRDQQEPNIRSQQEPNIRSNQTPFTYQHRSPSIYQDPRSYQAPFTYNHRSPATYQHRSPSTYNLRTPIIYQHRSPSIYQDPRSYQAPFTYQHRSPSTYNFRSPLTYGHRSPFTYQHRSPFTYRSPVSGQQPNIRNARTPRGYRNPVNAQEPNIRSAQSPSNARQPNSARSPFTYRNPVNGQQPVIGRTPFTYRNPVNGQQPFTSQSPFTYQHRNPIQIPFGGGCFAPGTMIWLGDGSHAPIEHCVNGQYIMTWNESTKIIEPKSIYHVMVPRIDSIYDVELSDGRILQVTDSHPLMLNNGEWGAFDVEKCQRQHDWMEGVNSHELKVGDSLFSMTDAIMFDRTDDVGLEIISINENTDMTVYNLSGVNENHNFFANGMLVHNMENMNPGGGLPK